MAVDLEENSNSVRSHRFYEELCGGALSDAACMQRSHRFCEAMRAPYAGLVGAGVFCFAKKACGTLGTCFGSRHSYEMTAAWHFASRIALNACHANVVFLRKRLGGGGSHLRTRLRVQNAGNREYSRFSALNVALDRPNSRNIWGLGRIL